MYFVLLLPDLAVLRARNEERTKVDVFHQAEMLDPIARHETRRVGMRLDTSDLSPRETVDRILGGLEAEARID